MNAIKQILINNNVVIIDNFVPKERLDYINEIVDRAYNNHNILDPESIVLMEEILQEHRTRIADVLEEINLNNTLESEYQYIDTTAGKPIEYKSDCEVDEDIIQYSTVFFLNDVEAGGQLDFVDIGKVIEPVKGRVVIWNNLTPKLTCNNKMKYDHLPVIKGTKSIISTRVKVNSI